MRPRGERVSDWSANRAGDRRVDLLLELAVFESTPETGERVSPRELDLVRSLVHGGQRRCGGKRPRPASAPRWTGSRSSSRSMRKRWLMPSWTRSAAASGEQRKRSCRVSTASRPSAWRPCRTRSLRPAARRRDGRRRQPGELAPTREDRCSCGLARRGRVVVEPGRWVNPNPIRELAGLELDPRGEGGTPAIASRSSDHPRRCGWDVSRRGFFAVLAGQGSRERGDDRR